MQAQCACGLALKATWSRAMIKACLALPCTVRGSFLDLGVHPFHDVTVHMTTLRCSRCRTAQTVSSFVQRRVDWAGSVADSRCYRLSHVSCYPKSLQSRPAHPATGCTVSRDSSCQSRLQNPCACCALHSSVVCSCCTGAADSRC